MVETLMLSGLVDVRVHLREPSSITSETIQNDATAGQVQTAITRLESKI